MNSETFFEIKIKKKIAFIAENPVLKELQRTTPGASSIFSGDSATVFAMGRQMQRRLPGSKHGREKWHF